MTILETFIQLRDDLKLWVTNNLKTKANISHNHTISDFTDYIVDTELSGTSTNPVQNKVIDDAINKAKEDASNKDAVVLYEAQKSAKDYTDSVAAGKADSVHTHNDIYYTKSEIDNLELITVDDIDTICGSNIVAASEVTF